MRRILCVYRPNKISPFFLSYPGQYRVIIGCDIPKAHNISHVTPNAELYSCFFRDVLQEWWHCLRDSKLMSDDWWCSSTKSFPSHGLTPGNARIPKSINEFTGQHDLAYPRRPILCRRHFEVDLLIRFFCSFLIVCYFVRLKTWLKFQYFVVFLPGD